jgi:hypothetical protein
MVTTALLVGGVFGLRHTFEADHVAAVTTLVEDEYAPASAGVAWGLGHSLPLLVLGALFLGLGVRLPAAVATAFEAVVALVLVALGLRVLAGREALGTTILRHIHGDRSTDRSHLHLAICETEVGFAHSHADEESFAVGVVHGLAGSGGVVVALVAAASTPADGAAFLVGFAVATVVAMGLAAWGWGRVGVRTHALRMAAGVASIVVGILLVAEVAGIGVAL